MTQLILVIAAIIFNYSLLTGQCNYKEEGRAFNYLKKSGDIDPDFITKPKAIFDKFGVAGSQLFIKSNSEDYYFGFGFFRSYSSRFEVLENNPIILFLDEGNTIELTPIKHFEGKFKGFHFNITLLYSIKKSQIELIINKQINSIRFYITAEKEIANTEVDENGRYFDFEVTSGNFKANFQNSAECFLNKLK